MFSEVFVQTIVVFNAKCLTKKVFFSFLVKLLAWRHSRVGKLYVHDMVLSPNKRTLILSDAGSVRTQNLFPIIGYQSTTCFSIKSNFLSNSDISCK